MSGPATDPERFDVFLSYNSREKATVEALCHKLRRDGLNPWLDTERLIPGTRWQDGLASGLCAAASCAIFIGKDDLGNWESEELHVAQSRAANDRGFRLIPVLLPGLTDPFDVSLLPPFLLSRTWIDLRSGLDEGSGYQRLVRAIRGLPPGPESDSLQLRADDESPKAEVVPYRGLETFNESNANIFFGRDADIQQLVEKLKAARFLAVIGASGSGKSSLVRAGLIPALRRGALPGSDEWRILLFRPGIRPLAELALQLVLFRGDQLPSSLSQIEEELSKDSRTLHNFVRLTSASGARDVPYRHVVFVVDQLEEIFTQCRDEDERTRFLDNLLHAATAVDGSVIVVLTLRADFYQKCTSHHGLAAFLGTRQFLVGPMTSENLGQVVVQPARVAGLAVEPELLDEVLAEVGGQPGTLPLLEYALLEVWKRRRGGLLTLKGYWESGGVRGALAQRAEAVYMSLGRAEQQIVQRVLLRLTQFGDGTDDTRRRARLWELSASPADTDTVTDVVNRLAEERLLTTNNATAPAEQTVEVAHEALIRGWPRFRKWVEEDRANLIALMRLAEAANEWQRERGDTDLLYRGARLSFALELRGTHEWQLNDLERKFLEASVFFSTQEEHRRRAAQRRQRNLLVALMILLTVAGLLAFNVRRQRDDARALLYVSDMKSAVLAAERRDVAEVRRAIEAHRGELANGARFEWSLLWRRYHSDVAEYRDSGGRLLSIALSPDGTELACAGADGHLVVWDIASHMVAATFRGHTGNVRAVAFSPDGRSIVSAGADGTVRLWDLRSGRGTYTFRGHNGSVGAVAFVHDNETIVSAGEDSVIRMWDVKTRSQIASMIGHTAPVGSLAVSLDGRWLASGGDDATVRLWSVPARAQTAVLVGHSDSVGALAFSSDGDTLASGSDDKTIILWDTRTGQHTRTLTAHGDIVRSVVFSPDGETLASASADATLIIWNAKVGSVRTTLRGHIGGVSAVAFSPDGKSITTGGDDGTAKVWLASTPPDITTLHGHAFHVTCVLFAPDGSRIASASDDYTIKLWDPATGRELATLRGHTGRVLRVAFSPDGTTLASSSDDRTVKLWDVRSGRNVATLKGHSDLVGSVAFSPTGTVIASASDDRTIKLWDSVSKRVIATLRGHGGLIRAMAFSPSGTMLASGSHDGTVRLWDIERRAVLSVLKGHTGIVRSVAFSPDGQILASGSDDESIRLWDVKSPGEMAILRGHSNAVRCVAFTPDGKTLAAVSVDGTIEIWDVRTKREMGILRGREADAYYVSFSPDGRVLATSSASGDAQLWRGITPGELSPGYSLQRTQ